MLGSRRRGRRDAQGGAVVDDVVAAVAQRHVRGQKEKARPLRTLFQQEQEGVGQ